jgi:uncharacterized protein
MTNNFTDSAILSIITGILAACWDLYRASAIYMLFGFFIAGILHVFIRADRIGAILGQGRFRPVFLSALIGVPIPLCSCGVIPVAAGLRKQGASKGATVSFLISTPESGIDSIAVTYALLDPIMTIMRPISAFFSAMAAGIMENTFGNKEPIPVAIPTGCGCTQRNCDTAAVLEESSDGIPSRNFFKTTLTKLSSGLSYAFVELLGDVGKWFIIGILIAGIISFVIPDVLLASISENRLDAMVLAMVAGIPMYVCATASTPIAAALILKGLDPGAALVFLLLGPATNIATMSMIYGLLGKRSLFIYLGSMVGCSLPMGFAVDALYAALHIAPAAVVGKAAEIMPAPFEITTSIVLGLLLLYSIATPLHTKKTKPAGTRCETC